MKLIFLESTWQELSKNTIFIYLDEYKCNLITFWHGLLPDMVTSHDSVLKFVIFVFKILFSIKF